MRHVPPCCVRGGELRRLIDELLPARAVLCELGPLLEVRQMEDDPIDDIVIR